MHLRGQYIEVLLSAIFELVIRAYGLIDHFAEFVVYAQVINVCVLFLTLKGISKLNLKISELKYLFELI